MRLLFLLLILLPYAAQAVTATSFTDTRAQTSTAIVSGTTTSAEIDLGGTQIVGLQMPTSFTGTAMTFQASQPPIRRLSFQTLADGAGNDISKTVAASKYIAIDPTLFRGIRFVKLVSGTTEGAGRTIVIFSIPAK